MPLLGGGVGKHWIDYWEIRTRTRGKRPTCADSEVEASPTRWPLPSGGIHPQTTLATVRPGGVNRVAVPAGGDIGTSRSYLPRFQRPVDSALR